MNALQRPILGDRARRGVASALRWVADRLREETPVHVEPQGLAARAQPAPWAASPSAAPSPVPVSAHVGVDEVGVAILPAAPELAVVAPAVVPGGDEDERIRAKVVEALHTIFDPEIPVDIYELGLIYAVDVRPDRTVNIRMTLTSPNCPAAQSLPAEVEVKASAVDGVDRADVEVVFEPPWTPDLMSDEARLELNIG